MNLSLTPSAQVQDVNSTVRYSDILVSFLGMRTEESLRATGILTEA